MRITGGWAIDHVKTTPSGCLRLYRIRTPPVRHAIDASRDEGSPCPPIASTSSSLPRSIAVVGASPRAGSLGLTFLRNLIAGGFAGAIYPVNPHHARSREGPASPRSSDAARGARSRDRRRAAGQGARRHRGGGRGRRARRHRRDGGARPRGGLARRSGPARGARAMGLRIVGPNCLGVMAPRAKLNASFAARSAKPGDLALVSQSGAVAAGLVEWAAQRHVGFSAIVSLGDKVDVDFSDCLDFFAADPRHAGDPALHRIHRRRAQVHVGGARRRAHRSRSWSSSRAAMRRARRPPRPIRARWRAPMRSTTPPSAAPGCCACSISTSSSPPPRRSAGRSRFPGSGWRS